MKKSEIINLIKSRYENARDSYFFSKEMYGETDKITIKRRAVFVELSMLYEDIIDG